MSNTPNLKKYWYIAAIILTALLVTWLVMSLIVHPKVSNTGTGNDSGNGSKKQAGSQQGQDDGNFFGSGKYPACPANLSGILTAPLIDPQSIAAMIPLGNVSPPGHTFPVDHIYFSLNTSEKVPLHAPADGWITHIMANSVMKTAGSPYEFESFVVTYTICDGLVLDFAGYNDVIQPVKDELAKYPQACKGGIKKTGHESAAEQQCDYQDLNIKVTAGQQIGYTQRVMRSDGSGFNVPFEIWAADYTKPARSDIDWSFYEDNRYAHAMCTFDLYAGSLKDQFDAKFGTWSEGKTKDKYGNISPGKAEFIPRTIQPLCGQIAQNISGSLQGAWFSHKPDKNDKSGSIGDAGFGISFIHNNIDPSIGEVVIGGEFENKLTGVIAFTPVHSGTINREPAEVKADGQVYCYSLNAGAVNGGYLLDGKLLVRLIDDHSLEADHLPGTCSSTETFSKITKFMR